MSAAEPGGPAFPVAGFMQEHGAYSKFELAPHGGMTLRDYFAGEAMDFMLNRWKDGHVMGWDGIASATYEFADAMLRAREGKL